MSLDNEVIATGGVFAALIVSPAALRARVVTDELGHATNEIDVRFAFLESTYRIKISQLESAADFDAEPEGLYRQGWQ